MRGGFDLGHDVGRKDAVAPGKIVCASLVVLILALCSAGCTKRIYVPVENERVNTDTLMVLRWRTDSVIERDTVNIYRNGDTLTRESVKWRYRIKVNRDTVYRQHCDTIRIRESYPLVSESSSKNESWWKYVTIICILLIIVLILRRI